MFSLGAVLTPITSGRPCSLRSACGEGPLILGLGVLPPSFLEQVWVLYWEGLLEPSVPELHAGPALRPCAAAPTVTLDTEAFLSALPHPLDHGNHLMVGEQDTYPLLYAPPPNPAHPR